MHKFGAYAQYSGERFIVNIDYLRYYLDVAETKSITHAARLNFISPQGMSRAMNELEKELDCKLLVRYSNKLAISEQGEALIPVAKKVVEQYDQLADYAIELGASNDESDEDNRIYLLCQAICGLCFIPPQTVSLLDRLDSPLVYREMTNDEIASTLHQSITETGDKPKSRQIGVTCSFAIDKQDSMAYIRRLEELGYTYRPYLRTYDECIVSADSELAKKNPLTSEDIANHPIVSTNTILYDTIVERFGEKNVIMTSAEFNFRMRFVETGDAVAFMPAIRKLFRENDRQGVVSRDFVDTYRLEIGFIGLKKDLDSPAFVSFVDSLNDFYERNQTDGDLFSLTKQ